MCADDWKYPRTSRLISRNPRNSKNKLKSRNQCIRCVHREHVLLESFSICILSKLFLLGQLACDAKPSLFSLLVKLAKNGVKFFAFFFFFLNRKQDLVFYFQLVDDHDPVLNFFFFKLSFPPFFPGKKNGSIHVVDISK